MPAIDGLGRLLGEHPIGLAIVQCGPKLCALSAQHGLAAEPSDGVSLAKVFLPAVGSRVHGAAGRDQRRCLAFPFPATVPSGGLVVVLGDLGASHRPSENGVADSDARPLHVRIPLGHLHSYCLAAGRMGSTSPGHQVDSRWCSYRLVYAAAAADLATGCILAQR